MLIGACAHETEFYSPDPERLKEVEKKVKVSSIETPTLSKPLVALSDHEAFMNAYFGGNSQVMASAIHRIADLHMIKENRKYERVLDSYAQRLRLYEQGRLRRPPTPPLTPYTVPRRLYERILELYPDRSENDSVLYQLARIYESTDRFERRKEMLKRLVVEYPASRYVSEVQFRLAEIYFEEGNYEEAMIAYKTAANNQDLSILDRTKKGAGERAETALKGATKRREQEMALYKSGWSQMASGDIEGAMKIFQDLLDQKKTILERRPFKFDPMVMSWEEWDFLQEVLRGVVIAFSNWGPPNKLQQYFRSIGHREYEYLLYQKLASLYLSRKRNLDAVKIYEMFIKVYPRDPESPGMALRIIDVYQRLKLLEPANHARIRFVKDFGKGSFWYKKASLDDRTKINPLLQRTTYQLALFYHSEAQKMRRTEDYKKAIRWYRTFLQNYPEETEATRVNFLLAEGLYELGKYKEAVAEYEKTAYEYPLHQDSAEAGFAVIFAREKLLNLATKTGEDPKTGPSALRVAGASVRFAETFPSDERALETRLKAAEIYFHARRFKDARHQAEVVTVAYVTSRHPTAYRALLLIANSHFEEKAYTLAVEIYRKLNATEISIKDRKEIKKLWSSALYKHAERLKETGKLKEAENAFYQVQREVPDSEVAPVSLYDAGLLAIDGGNLDGALGAFGLLVQQYPNSDLSKKVPRFLLQTEKELLNEDRYEEAQTLAAWLENMGSDLHDLRAYQAQLLIANRYFEEKDYANAVKIYRKVNVDDISADESLEVKRLWSSALYKHAERLKETGKLKEAENAFYQVQREVPDSEVAPVSLYDAGLLAIDGGNLDGALGAFGLLVNQYPKTTYVVHAALEMARINERQGKLKNAASGYERVTTFTEDRKMIADSLLAAGSMYDQLKDWKNAERVYRQYIETESGEFEKVAEIRFKMIEMKQKLAMDTEARELIAAFIKQYSLVPEDASKANYYLSKAYLYSADYLRIDYEAIKLVVPLEENLGRKKQLLSEVLDLYILAADSEIKGIVTEAAYHIGSVFEEFGTALMSSERPKGLTAQQIEQYNFILEDQAYPFEEKAIAAFESNVKRAQQLGLYDGWIKRSYKKLERLLPGRYLKPELQEVFTQELVSLP
jgi:TolA-binding protein